MTGQSPCYSVSMSGTVPMHQVCAQHRVPLTTLGAARDDCDAHAPNENVRIEDLATATRIMARFLDRFAAPPRGPERPLAGVDGRERRADPRLVATPQERDPERAQLAAANPSAMVGSAFMNASAAASSGASNTHSPVFVLPSVGPTSTIDPSSNRRWIRTQWRPQTSFSASVIVSAKSSRGGWMK